RRRDRPRAAGAPGSARGRARVRAARVGGARVERRRDPFLPAPRRQAQRRLDRLPADRQVAARARRRARAAPPGRMRSYMGVDVTTPKPIHTPPGDEIVAWARGQLGIARSILDNPGGGLLFATQ